MSSYLQLEPATGSIQKREVLAETRINEFISTLRRSNYRGVYKEPMPYLLKLNLGGGQTAELKATEDMVSDWRKDYYYAVDLKRFFPRFFEQFHPTLRRTGACSGPESGCLSSATCA